MADIFTNSPSTLDFEENNLNDLDGSGTEGGGTIAASSTQAHSSTYSCRAQSDADGSGANGYKAISWPVGDIAYARWFIRMAASGGNSSRTLNCASFGFMRNTGPYYQSDSNVAMVALVRGSTRELTIYYRDNVGNTRWDTGVILSVGQWYEIEFKLDKSGANLAMSVWVDSTEYTQNGSGQDSNDAAYLWAGAGSYYTAGAKDFYYDDIQAADTRIGGGGEQKKGTATLAINAATTSTARRARHRAATLPTTATTTTTAHRTRRRAATLATTATTSTTAHRTRRRATTLALTITISASAHTLGVPKATLSISIELTAKAYLIGLGYVQTSWGHRPALALTIQDRRDRFFSLHYADDNDQYTDQATDATTIHRATTDASGNVRHCAVTNPATAAQWTDWATHETGATASSEIAIAVYSTTNFHIYFLKTEAANDWEIDCKPYVAGEWQTHIVILNNIDGAKAGDDPEPPRLAACNGYLFYTDAGFIKSMAIPIGGPAGNIVSWTSLGALSSRDGLAVTRDGDNCHVIACEGGRLHYGVFDANAATWSSPTQLHPGSHGTPADDHTLRDPSLEQHDDRYWLSFVDENTAAPTWAVSTICHTTDFAHLCNHTTLRLGTGDTRVALAAIPSTHHLYAANQSSVVHSKHYHPSHPDQHISNLTPSSYTLKTTPTGSLLRMWILNTGDRFSTYGQTDTTYEAIRPLSTISLQRGYHTSQGRELATLPPHLITRITLNKGMDQRYLEIEARDGWAVLDAWRPSEVLSYVDQSIEWLMTELLALVGFTPNLSEYNISIDETLDLFTLKPTHNGAHYLRQLMRLAGQIAWWNTDGEFRAENLYSWSPDVAGDTGDNNEARSSAYTTIALLPNRFRIFGDGYAAASVVTWYSGTDGLILPQDHTDFHITNANIATNIRRFFWRMAIMNRNRYRVQIPLRADTTLWDKWRIVDATRWPSTLFARITAIEEHSNPRRKIHHTTLTLIDA